MTIQQHFQQANGILEKADLLFDEATCRAALERMAAEITADLAGQYPLLLPVMGGAVVFTGQLLPLCASRLISTTYMFPATAAN